MIAVAYNNMTRLKGTDSLQATAQIPSRQLVARLVKPATVTVPTLPSISINSQKLPANNNVQSSEHGKYGFTLGLTSLGTPRYLDQY